MRGIGSHLIDFRNLDQNQILNFFLNVKESKNNRQATLKPGKIAILAFFEASTLTRVSFEMAALRAGVQCLNFNAGAGTSLEKGETVEDSLKNLLACSPDLMVVRAGDDLNFDKIAAMATCPILSGGWGKWGHPTQALLDVFSLFEIIEFSKLRLLFLGDVLHSRVARSNIELLRKFNVEMAVCGPSQVCSELMGVKYIEKLDDALVWANAVMALRYQFERFQNFSKEEILSSIQNYQLNSQSLKSWKKSGILMHPGPVNQGVEMTSDVYEDSRSIILSQVNNGVHVRETLIRQILFPEEA